MERSIENCLLLRPVSRWEDQYSGYLCIYSSFNSDINDWGHIALIDYVKIKKIGHEVEEISNGLIYGIIPPFAFKA